jgi:uncharacterized membrane protein YfcA
VNAGHHLHGAALLGLLAVVGLAFIGVWAWWLFGPAGRRPATRDREGGGGVRAPTAYEALVGVVTDFFDTLGISSFATTTALYKLRSAVSDRLIPGTLNVGHALPTIAQAIIYIAIVRVDVKTLSLMIAASVCGAWLGAGVVASWPKRTIQLGMGIALAAAATLMLGQQVHATAHGGSALGLEEARLAVGMAGNFALGALMTLGIGLYAPCMILVSLLGMNPIAAFPIMMGSCAFLMPIASLRFLQKGAYAPGAALGLTLGGVPAVLVAAWVVRSLPLQAVRWLVIGIVLYTALAMLRSARRGAR